MRNLTIDGKLISDEEPAFCIAELGHNHGGSVEVCKGMIRSAAWAKADAVKLQKRDNRSLYTQGYYDREYTSENAYGPTYGAHREALEFGAAEYRTLEAEADHNHVTFFATAFDEPSATFLAENTASAAFKIASGDLTNTPLLRYVASYGKPMIVSTGAASQADVDRAMGTIWPINQQVGLLHCTAEYPAPAASLNLRVISTYRERYPEVVVGLSSHYSGISDAVVAYMLGARIFEKHFTLNRSAKGTDHAFSLQPAGFAKMVSYLSEARLALGDGVKVCREAEVPALEKMGTALYYARDLPAGHVLEVRDMAIKTPGGRGYPPYMREVFVGTVLKRQVWRDQLVGD